MTAMPGQRQRRLRGGQRASERNRHRGGQQPPSTGVHTRSVGTAPSRARGPGHPVTRSGDAPAPAQPQIAPWAAEPTSFAYFAEDAPGVAGRQRGPALPAAGQLGVVHQQFQGAGGEVEPDRVAVAHEGDRAAVGSLGRDVPDAQPVVPPEKRPSVSSRTSLPSPAPLIAPVTASISRMPGPPRGPRTG